jgi:hypothetical protein
MGEKKIQYIYILYFVFVDFAEIFVNLEEGKACGGKTDNLFRCGPQCGAHNKALIYVRRERREQDLS